MNGIEKLTQQINADAQVEIDALLAEGKAKAEAVLVCIIVNAPY